MTKKQYLKKLEYCIQALPADERNEALDYYSNYFDDADDDDKVMQELGEPEDLAKTIIEKFTCVPAKAKKSKNSNEEAGENSESSDYVSDEFEGENYYSERLYYEFEKEQVKNLGILVGAGQFVIRTGKGYSVETRGISEEDFRCEINSVGTLIVENKKFPANRRKYGNALKNKWCPRVLITIPETAEVENLKLVLSAGQITTKPLNLKAEKAMVDVTAGNFMIDGLNSKAANIKAAMGNVEITGKLEGFTKVDCAMASVKIVMNGKEKDYSFSGKVGMGGIKFGSDSVAGFSKTFADDKKENHCQIKVGMGEVKISFEK